jgi:hypothetical protein
MQHDTSPYNIQIGGKKVKRHCASLVFGFSRMMYIQFYPKFDRFHCKIFLTAAFQYLDGVCRRCVIDNCSIIIACGAGQTAQVAPEMEAFEQRFGFHFLAHAVGHANRSGKVERPFRYIETNFLVGRRFKDDADLNAQAVRWLEETANCRQMRALKASPLELFAAEKAHLVALPVFVPEVYRPWQRSVDGYGCISLHGIKYAVPNVSPGKTLMIREYQDRIVILDGSKELSCQAKRSEGDGQPPPDLPRPPRRRRKPCRPEEAALKSLGPGMCAYLAALKENRPSRYVFSVKLLYRYSCHYKTSDLLYAVALAAQYRLFDVKRIETILLQQIAQRDYELPLTWKPGAVEQLPGYPQGATTPEPDWSEYTPQKQEDDDPEDEPDAPAAPCPS